MSEQRWSALDAILEHKAAKAGIRYVRVNAAYTSTDCSQCGHRQAMPLNKRVYDCGRCGMVLCRDVNAATNICARAFPRLGGRAGKGSGNFPRCSAHNKLCQGDRPPPHGCDAGGRYRTVRPECQLRSISPIVRDHGRDGTRHGARPPGHSHARGRPSHAMLRTVRRVSGTASVRRVRAESAVRSFVTISSLVGTVSTSERPNPLGREAACLSTRSGG